MSAKAIRTNFGFPAIVAVLATLLPAVSFAAGGCSGGGQSLGDVACTVSQSYEGFFDILAGISYLTGAMFGFKAALQLKDHTDNSQQTKLSKPLTTLMVSTLLLTFPSTIDMMVGTFFQGGLQSVSDLYSQITSGGGGSSQSNDLGGMFVSLSRSLPALVYLVSIGSRLLGAILILKTLYMLPHMEQGRESGSKILWTAISAVGLFSFPVMFQTITDTMTGSILAPGNSSVAANPLTAKYATTTPGGDFGGVITSVLMFVQLIGAVAFVRGLLLLKEIGENKGGAMGRGLTHIFGGAAAMNITWAITMLANTIGAHSQICGIASGVMCSF